MFFNINFKLLIMINQITNYYKFILSTILVLVAFSCETEPVGSGEDLLLESQSKQSKKKNKTDVVIFDQCDFTANEVKLVAGQFMEVGKVTVEDNLDGNYKITYTITDDDYCITETHLSVVNSTDGFPMSNGGPKNGAFEYSDSHECESVVEYIVPMEKGTYIAAHAVVNCKTGGSAEDVYASLPMSVDFCLRTGREIENARSYFRADIAEGVLAGSYWAWCADVNKSIDSSGEGKCYQGFNVYSLNDDLSGIITQSENIDNVLWLINNSDELLNSGNYLYGNIQWAIWKLLNNQECNSCNTNLKLPTGDITIKGMELYELAMTSGEGYNPECGENTMVILDNGINKIWVKDVLCRYVNGHFGGYFLLLPCPHLRYNRFYHPLSDFNN